MEYNLAVFIGRFQPCHLSHIEAIKQALNIAERLLIVVGSSHAAPNIKNPFTFEERCTMIKIGLGTLASRVSFAPVRDYYYNENTWITEVQNAVSLNSSPDDAIVLIKNYKDSSSYYLNLFPQWDEYAVRGIKNMDATEVRRNLFDPKDLEEVHSWKDKRTGSHHVGSFDANLELLLGNDILEYLTKGFMLTERHYSLIKEYQFIKNYKQAWANAPYAPTFVTTDAVVIKSGHVLLIRRKFEPGKGLYALPGGFIKQDEHIEAAAIRELKEETKIDIPKPVLYNSIKSRNVFDHPERSLRGRTITHGFFIDLGHGPLPLVRASDDASGAQWVPIMDLGRLESEMYEDHIHIINYFINR
jgi:bifunctional NMN adenylyltransferase/nudix hydrolase